MKRADFSPRQWEIIELVGRDGLRWDRVSATLEISEGTVRTHVSRVRQKVDSTRSPRDLMVAIYHQCGVPDSADGDSAVA